jgi:hypothetical protein
LAGIMTQVVTKGAVSVVLLSIQIGQIWSLLPLNCCDRLVFLSAFVQRWETHISNIIIRSPFYTTPGHNLHCIHCLSDQIYCTLSTYGAKEQQIPKMKNGTQFPTTVLERLLRSRNTRICRHLRTPQGRQSSSYLRN